MTSPRIHQRVLRPLIWLLVASVAVLPGLSEAGIRICKGDDGSLSMSVVPPGDDTQAPCPRQSERSASAAETPPERDADIEAAQAPLWSTCFIVPCAPTGNSDLTLVRTTDVRPQPAQDFVVAVIPPASELRTGPGVQLAYSGFPPPTSSLSPLLRSVVLLI